MHELDRCGERVGRHHVLPNARHVLAVVMTEQRIHPCHELREAVLGNLAGHDTHRLGLVGHRDALLDEAVDVAVFLGQVQVEVKLERRGRPRRLQRIAG